MSSLRLSKNTKSTTTVIHNTFIDEYMTDANDAQLKVYLYLTRVINANQAVSVPEIADRFNHTERDVMRSLKYWEKKGLMALDYDDNKNLVGVELIDPSTVNQLATGASVLPAAKREIAAAAVSDSTPTYTVPAVPAKPSYSAEDLKSFRENPETGEILFVTEQYLKKPLTVADVKSIMYMNREFHFNADLIDYLIQYCVSHDKKELRDIVKIAATWMEAGIKNTKDAKKYASAADENYGKIMKALGRDSYPTTYELDFIRRWTKEYGFGEEMIVEACNRASLSTGVHRFEYTDGILHNWLTAGVRTPDAIAKAESAFRPRKNVGNGSAASGTSAAGSGHKGSTSSFTGFHQNDYDFSKLEEEILCN